MFQVFLNHIFTDMIAEKWLKIYMDNLGIHTKDNLELHHQQRCRVLSYLQKHGLSLKISKCSFDTPTMEYLRMIIGQGLVHMDPTKLTAIKEWYPPSSVMILFPHCSILLFTHTRCLLTWRGRCHSYINTSYLFIHTLSSFCFLDLSMDIANS